MAGRGVPKAIVPSVARRCRSCRQAGLARSDARAASDRLALSQHVTPPEARQRPRRDARTCGGGGSFFYLPSHYLITFSARAGSVAGPPMPRALAGFWVWDGLLFVGALPGS